MGYKDVDGVDYWVDEREIPSIGDPYRIAAETLARDNERYLYRQHNPDGSPGEVWMKPEFLAWAVGRFDSCKTGSGGMVHELDYDHDSASITAVRPPAQRTTGTTDIDLAVRYSDDEKKAQGKRAAAKKAAE